MDKLERLACGCIRYAYDCPDAAALKAEVVRAAELSRTPDDTLVQQAAAAYWQHRGDTDGDAGDDSDEDEGGTGR